MSDAYPSECHFCSERFVLEDHHIVPRRFGGSDAEENIVTVCPTCHQKLEKMYDKRFYDRLGVDTETDGSDTRPTTLATSELDLDEFVEKIGIVLEADTPAQRARYAVCVQSKQLTKLRFSFNRVYNRIGAGALSGDERLLPQSEYRKAIRHDDQYVTETSIMTRFPNGDQIRAVGVGIPYLEPRFPDFPLGCIPDYDGEPADCNDLG